MAKQEVLETLLESLIERVGVLEAQMAGLAIAPAPAPVPLPVPVPEPEPVDLKKIEREMGQVLGRVSKGERMTDENLARLEKFCEMDDLPNARKPFSERLETAFEKREGVKLDWKGCLARLSETA